MPEEVSSWGVEDRSTRHRSMPPTSAHTGWYLKRLLAHLIIGQHFADAAIDYCDLHLFTQVPRL